MELEKHFDSRIVRRVKKEPRARIISTLLKEYYDETLEEAQSNPRSFGDDSPSAEEDPRALARHYTENFRDALNQKERKYLEYLFANHIKDHEEIAADSDL